MTVEERLDELERELRYMKDRQAILDCIARNARGCDRHDAELLASSYHPDGFDEHGFAVNEGPRYPEWANAAHNAMSQQSLHNITTHSCEIDGDVAHAETYSVGLFLDPDGKTARMLAGRYADRLERREGEWRIALRRTTVDILLVGEAAFLTSEAFAQFGYLKGMRDKRDVSYQRPLTLERTSSDRW
ncbi:nuclear transport factor 2 family protein [Phenylobacterium sp. LjRoot225]|uniref:nuclear transport factor 2 family protein n=1 Tax=Phenylobacterium sp. LjRoot225 TaxID=3342285 RepID=UPI003ECF52B1